MRRWGQVVARLAPAVWACSAAFGCQPAVAEGIGRAEPRADEQAASLPRLILSGEIDAADGHLVLVPRVPQWNVTLRWIEQDGAAVAAGQKVAELDDSEFTLELTQKKIMLAQARAELLHQKNENAITQLDRRFDVEQARIELEKARLAAAVDRESYPLRVYQEHQLELRRRVAALETALDARRSQRKTAELEERVLQIALEKGEREIAESEAAISALALCAPRAGTVIRAVHPWFRRKVQSGDNVWVNLELMRLPELSTLEVQARLSDVDDGRIAPGMRVMTYLDAYPEVGFPGAILSMSPIAREMSRESLRRSYAVRVSFDHIDAARMLPGMSVRVEVLGSTNTTAPGAPEGGG